MGSLDKGIYDFFRNGKMPKQHTQIGTFSSGTAGRGVVVSSSRTAGYRIYTDDGGVALPTAGSVPDIRGTLSRTLITTDNTSGHIRAFGLMGQLKGYNAKWNTEQVGAVLGRLEIVRTSGTITLGGYGISAAGAFTAETSGTITVDTNHILAGVLALSDFKATLTQTGKTAAFVAAAYDTSNWSDSTARTKWGYGLYVKGNAVGCGMLLGDFASATAGSGIPLSATNTAAARIYTDDGGAKLGAGEKRALISRFLYATEDTDNTDQTMSGIVGQLKFVNNITASGNMAGVCGYLECSGTKTLTIASTAVATALWARVDVPSGFTIGSGTVVSGIGVTADLGGTHTGRASVVNVVNPSGGAWDAFAEFGNATGCTVTTYTGNSGFDSNSKGTFTQAGQIKIVVGGSTYYIPYGTVS